MVIEQHPVLSLRLCRTRSVFRALSGQENLSAFFDFLRLAAEILFQFLRWLRENLDINSKKKMFTIKIVIGTGV